MKKILFSLSFLLLIQGISISMPGLPGNPHDSLLFGGEDGNPIHFLEQLADKCMMQVSELHGKAWGMVLVDTEYVEDCEKKFKGKMEVKRSIKKGDVLVAGYEIVTNMNSGMRIMLSDGAELTIDQGTRFTMQRDCSNKYDFYEITEADGRIIVSTGHKQPVIISTDKASITPKGTQFSVKVVNDVDTTVITKVYEGSVEVSLLHPEAPTDSQKDIEQASIDLQNGKITVQEFAEKMKEYKKANMEYLDSIKPVTVTEGNKCTATKSTMKVEPIEAGDEHWWENLK